MHRRRFIGLTLGTGAAAAFAGKRMLSGYQRIERTSWALGSNVTITACHPDARSAERAINTAFLELDRLEDVLSLYRPHSQISALNRDGILDNPDADLVAVLTSALAWSHATNGAFDPTVQPLWPLYATGKPPDLEILESTRRRIGWQRVELSPGRVRLGPNQAITLNGIAQGFAADRVCDVLRAHGIEHALVNTGEFGPIGTKPNGDPWKLGIQHPRTRDALVALTALDGRFLATSGDYETAFCDDFTRHHIFDPASGRSPTTLSSVSVLAPSGIEADALSTAIFVLGPERGLELAASRERVDVLLVLRSLETRMTAGFPRTPGPN